MLKLNGVFRKVRNVDILTDISFELPKGAILAVLGPSGSGKTTLLRSIMGLDLLSQGTISWGEQILTEGKRTIVPTEKRNFGMVFQDTALFPHFNVLKNVCFGLQQQNYPNHQAKQEEAEKWLERFNLKNFKKRKIDTLSGGELQRVALARSLAPGPSLLLLDEPFSNIDRLVRHELIASLKPIFQATQSTIILVTHDARDAFDLGTHLSILREGKIIRFGILDEVKTSPGCDWASHFLACGFN